MILRSSRRFLLAIHSNCDTHERQRALKKMRFSFARVSGLAKRREKTLGSVYIQNVQKIAKQHTIELHPLTFLEEKYYFFLFFRSQCSCGYYLL